MAKKSIPISLDKVRNIRYGMVALSLFEDTTGKEFTSMDFNRLSIKDIGMLIWVGLYYEDAELTVTKVMELIDEHSSIEEAAELLGKAIDEAFPEKKKRAAVKAKSGTGIKR